MFLSISLNKVQNFKYCLHFSPEQTLVRIPLFYSTSRFGCYYCSFNTSFFFFFAQYCFVCCLFIVVFYFSCIVALTHPQSAVLDITLATDHGQEIQFFSFFYFSCLLKNLSFHFNLKILFFLCFPGLVITLSIALKIMNCLSHSNCHLINQFIPSSNVWFLSLFLNT